MTELARGKGMEEEYRKAGIETDISADAEQQEKAGQLPAGAAGVSEREIEEPAPFTAPEVLYDDLVKTIKSYHPSEELSLIRKAYEVADQQHAGQKRRSGEPYIMLFRRVASVLSQRNLSVAVAATQTADFVRTPASMGGRNASCFKFSSLPVPPCDCEPQDHTARAASSAASACNTVLGVAMSNIFLLKRNGSEQYVVYIAVAHDTNVTVSRVYSGDLPVKDFLKKTACELFSLLSCIVEALYGNAEPDDFEVF